jgi:GT2 family glycosyltransferase
VIPKISIITPTIGWPRYVEDTIASVPPDAPDEVEHIIVHDGEKALSNHLTANYTWLRVIAGPGRGPTAAYAAAIASASGDFIFMLNSDDLMLPGAINAILRSASERPDVEAWTGGTLIFTLAKDGRKRTVRTLDDPAVTALTLTNILDDLPLMTARFVRRSVYARVGPLDERFSACSDREFALRMVLAGVHEEPLGVRVSELRMHDDSETIRNPSRKVPAYLQEHLAIAWGRMLDPTTPIDVRNALRDWHARETVRKAYYEMRAGDIRALGRSFRTTFSRDMMWPWHARSLLSTLRLRRRQSHMPSSPAAPS